LDSHMEHDSDTLVSVQFDYLYTVWEGEDLYVESLNALESAQHPVKLA
jgi:hypothetical protein